jgi:outer membrane beta-barrel protein
MKRIFWITWICSCLPQMVSAQSPNERVHALQKRDYSVKNKIEVGLQGGPSIGDVFTQQYSLAVVTDYHVNEAFALEALWMTCKLGSERFGEKYTGAYNEVKNDAQLSPSNADLAMISNYAGINVQFSPIYGKFSLFNWGLGHADFYLAAGGGVAFTEYRKANRDWVDTGNYFVGSFGAGLRIFLTPMLALRLDLRDFTFAARVKGEGGQAAPDETKIRNSLFITLGVSFLFGGEAPVEIWSPY